MINKKQKGIFRKSHSYIISYDNVILVMYILLCLFGLFMLLDIGASRERMPFLGKQAMWFLFAIGTMYVTFNYLDLQRLRKYISIALLGTVVLLCMVFLNDSVKGGTRWIRFLGVTIQPSILASNLLILYYANYLDKKREQITKAGFTSLLLDMKPLWFVPAVIFVLILKEHHFSILVVTSMTLISMLFLAGARIKTLLTALVIILLMGVIVIKSGESYRGNRMDIFSKYSLFHKVVGAGADSVAADDYQIRESLTALSMGGFFGTSPSKGRAKHYFLPDARTDYIFSVIGEEFGFLGAFVILMIFTGFFYKCMTTSFANDDYFLKMIGMGFSVNIFITALVNIGVSISALPSTGLTLPFISYGGSSLVVNSFAVGVILNISSVRKIV